MECGQGWMTCITIHSHVKFTRTTRSSTMPWRESWESTRWGEGRQHRQGQVWLWLRGWSPIPGEAGGREHQRRLLLVSRVTLCFAQGSCSPVCLNCDCRRPRGCNHHPEWEPSCLMPPVQPWDSSDRPGGRSWGPGSSDWGARIHLNGSPAAGGSEVRWHKAGAVRFSETVSSCGS